MLAGEDPQVVSRQQEDRGQGQRPGPAQQQQHAGTGGHEAGRKDEKQGRIVAPVDYAQDDDPGQRQQIKADGRQAGKRQQIAPLGLGFAVARVILVGLASSGPLVQVRWS